MILNYCGHFINQIPLYTSLEKLGDFVTLGMLSILCLFLDIGNEILTLMRLELLQNPR